MVDCNIARHITVSKMQSTVYASAHITSFVITASSTALSSCSRFYCSYKLCYFSRTWSPSSVTLPPLRQDPYGSPVDETSAATNVRHPCSPTSGSEQLDHGREHFRGTVSVQLPSDRDVGGPTDGIDGASGVSLEGLIPAHMMIVCDAITMR